MKRALIASMILLFCWTSFAQTNSSDAPASQEDIQRYFQVAHSHDMMKKMMAAMAAPMHQMLHEQYLKHQDQLPSDYESKMNAMADDMLQNMPLDEMTQAMAPVYQKHFTKGDVDNLIAFYSSPTGEKMLRELPAIMAESMQSAMPIMMKYMQTVQQRLLKETDVMVAQSKKPSKPNAPASNN